MSSHPSNPYTRTKLDVIDMNTTATEHVVTPEKKKNNEELFDFFDSDDDVEKDLKFAVSVANEEDTDDDDDGKLVASIGKKTNTENVAITESWWLTERCCNYGGFETYACRKYRSCKYRNDHGFELQSNKLGSETLQLS